MVYRCMGCMEYIEAPSEVCPLCGYRAGTWSREGMELNPGSILAGRYIIGRVLGCGGFGITYIGYDAALERKVAIKEYLPSMLVTRMPKDKNITVYSEEYKCQFQDGLLGFVQEAGRVASFHALAGVVDVYDTIEENGTAYIIMEYLEGWDLKHVQKENGVMTWETVRDMASELCDTLEVIHQAGVIHRDISPDNIYLTKHGELKLIDFGAARYESSKNSKSLSVILKPGYAPEEQYRSHGIQGPFTDVYALAATCYKMLTGITPEDAMERAVSDQLVSPSALAGDMPETFENAILNALAVRAEDRTKTAAQFKAELLGGDTKRLSVKANDKSADKMKPSVKIALIAGLLLAFVLAVLAAAGSLGTGAGRLLSDTFGSGLKEGYVNAPGIMNLSQQEAKTAVENAGLSYLVTGKEYSEKIEKDRVLSQAPLPGRALKTGSVVEAVICGGAAEKKPGEIPDVVYETYETGKEMLEAAGISVECRFIYNEDVKAGLITEQAEKEGGPVLLTVSLGGYREGETLHTVPLSVLRLDGNVVFLDFAAPVKGEEAQQVVFEYDQGYDNWKSIGGFDATYKTDYFSSASKEKPQSLISQDVLMSLVCETALPDSAQLEVRVSVVSTEYPYDYAPAEPAGRIIVDKTPSLYPPVKLKSVEEADWEQVEETLKAAYSDADIEKGNPYKVYGSFRSGYDYYVYDGSAAFGRNRSISCGRDGELMVISDKELTPSVILGSIIPLYGSEVTEDGSILMKAGTPVLADSRYYAMDEGQEELKGRGVMDAVERVSKKAGKYRFRIPYRFRFECSDTVPRGHVIDYVLEQEAGSREIYRLDMVVSNGKKGEGFKDAVVPVQWILPENNKAGAYADLIYFTLPPDSLPPDERYTYHSLLTDNPDVGFYGEQGENYLNAILRGDGGVDKRFYPPEGYFAVEPWAEIMIKQGLIKTGARLYAGLMPAIPNSDVVTGDALRLEVPQT